MFVFSTLLGFKNNFDKCGLDYDILKSISEFRGNEHNTN